MISKCGAIMIRASEAKAFTMQTGLLRYATDAVPYDTGQGREGLQGEEYKKV